MQQQVVWLLSQIRESCSDPLGLSESYTSLNVVDSLTAILVSRFLIDLQEANNALMHQGSLASMDSLAFNRFVGSLGAPLPAPLAFEPPSVSENDEQPEERREGEAQAVATLQVE